MKKDYAEIFEQYKELSNNYWLIVGSLEIDNIDGEYVALNINEECYYIVAGIHANEILIDKALKDEESFNVPKPGIYSFEALLVPINEEDGKSYATIEHIELKYSCSLEEHRDHLDAMNDATIYM